MLRAARLTPKFNHLRRLWPFSGVIVTATPRAAPRAVVIVDSNVLTLQRKTVKNFVKSLKCPTPKISGSIALTWRFLWAYRSWAAVTHADNLAIYHGDETRYRRLVTSAEWWDQTEANFTTEHQQLHCRVLEVERLFNYWSKQIHFTHVDSAFTINFFRYNLTFPTCYQQRYYIDLPADIFHLSLVRYSTIVVPFSPCNP